MERTPDKPHATQDLKREDRKHEAAREARPDRPVPAEGDRHDWDGEKRKRDKEQDKQGFDADYGKENRAKVEGDEDGSDGVVDVSEDVMQDKPDETTASTSQGI